MFLLTSVLLKTDVNLAMLNQYILVVEIIIIIMFTHKAKLIQNGLEASKHGLGIFSLFHTEEFILTCQKAQLVMFYLRGPFVCNG